MSQDWRDRADFGQADYSQDYGYDPVRRTGYRIDADLRLTDEEREYARRVKAAHYVGDVAPPPRSWDARAGGMVGRDAESRRERRRREPSDRLLWAIIAERLDDERRLDLRDIELIVVDGEVTLNGTVAHKADKRRIEDVADIDGVNHVQNNLRVRQHNMWGFR